MMVDFRWFKIVGCNHNIRWRVLATSVSKCWCPDEIETLEFLPVVLLLYIDYRRWQYIHCLVWITKKATRATAEPKPQGIRNEIKIQEHKLTFRWFSMAFVCVNTGTKSAFEPIHTYINKGCNLAIIYNALIKSLYQSHS